jgi:hypothetical protein
MDIIEECFRHKPLYIMAERDDGISGILPMFEIKSRFLGHALVSLPFVVYGGICSIDAESTEKLLKTAATLGRIMGVDYVELRNQDHVLSHCDYGTDSASRSLIGQNKSYANNREIWHTKDLYVTFFRDISPDIESNFNALPRKQRRMIRQGMKAAFTTKIGGKEYLDIFYKLYALNKRNLGTPVFPIHFFRRIMDKFPQTLILSVWKNNVMVAGVMSFAFKDRLMPYFSGALRKYYRYAVNDFMYWELMRYGCEKNYKVFDFGRSKKGTGSYDFKRHWGFNPKSLPYAFHLVKQEKMPDLSPLNPKFSTTIAVWKKLPLQVANWLGPKIVRNIP